MCLSSRIFPNLANTLGIDFRMKGSSSYILDLRGQTNFEWLEDISTVHLNICGSLKLERTHDCFTTPKVIKPGSWVELSSPTFGTFKSELVKLRDHFGQIIPDQMQFNLIGPENENLLTVNFTLDGKLFNIIDPNFNTKLGMFVIPSTVSTKIQIYNFIDDEVYNTEDSTNPDLVLIKSNRGNLMAKMVWSAKGNLVSKVVVVKNTLTFVEDEKVSQSIKNRRKAAIIGILIASGVLVGRKANGDKVSVQRVKAWNLGCGYWDISIFLILFSGVVIIMLLLLIMIFSNQ